MRKINIKNFYIQSAIFSILSVLSALLGYLIYPVLARVLSVNEFGDFAVIMALINQVLGVLVAVNIISIYLVKRFGQQESLEKIQVIQKILVWVFIFLSVIVISLSPIFVDLFKVDQVSLFFILAAILITSLPLVVWSGYLQGNKELVRIGVFNTVSSAAKLVFAIVFALLFGAFGGLIGVLLGLFVGFIVIKVYPGVKLPQLKTIFYKMDKKEIGFLKSINRYITATVFVVGILGILQNFDISLAKSLFGPEIAGTYSGVSVVSKGLYYLAFILVWIVLPEITIGNTKTNRRVMSTAYKIIGLIAVITIILEIVLIDQLTQFLLGEGFSKEGTTLIFATLYQLTLVSITLHSFYLLVLRKSRSVLLVAITLLFCFSLPIIFGKNPLFMIQALWLSLILAVSLYSVLIRIYNLRSKT